jgi:RNA polymerase sigma-70 factor (ECF subfamily)
MVSLDEYNEAVDKYSDALYRFCLKNTGNIDDAKDLVQDAFEKLWKNRKKINHQKIKSYLFTVAYHKFIDNYRKYGKVDYLEDNFTEPSYEIKYTDIHEILEKALDKLPPVQKSILLLHDWEGYSYKEIQQITNLSETQVKVYIYRARKFLRQYIGKLEYLI